MIGHRGAAAVAPENTLAALEAAVAARADLVEFDVGADLTLAHSHRERPAERLDLDAALEFLRAHATRRVKVTLPGPFTLSRQAVNEHYPDGRSLALAFADAVNEEARELAAAGADVIQLDEPWLQARPGEAREYALEAIDRALAGVAAETALHTCFGYAHIVHDRLPGRDPHGRENGRERGAA